MGHAETARKRQQEAALAAKSTALHIGRVMVADQLWEAKEPPVQLLLQKFIWYVTCHDSLREFTTVIGVCPEFDLVRNSHELPLYNALCHARADGELRVELERVNEGR